MKAGRRECGGRREVKEEKWCNVVVGGRESMIREHDPTAFTAVKRGDDEHHGAIEYRSPGLR